MVKMVIGTVATENGSRYLQQLCKDWASQFSVWCDADRGTVELNGSQVTMTALPGMLRIAIEAWDAQVLPRIKQVVTEHLDRFAVQEGPLTFVWR